MLNIGMAEMNNFEHATGDFTTIDQHDIDRLIDLARKDPQHKFRYCSHLSPDDKCQEMVIVHLKDTIVPIHKHIGKSESFCWLRGYADVELFTDEGELFKIIPMGQFKSPGCTYYYRLNSDTYHSLNIISPVVVFLEVTNGPWHKEDLILAPWWKPPAGWTR